jgi:phosphoglycolate phosphatase-like HAD superfamily hydrolase
MILFDFDGVLMHSRREVVLNSYRAITGEGVETAAELPPGFEAIFLKNSSLVQPAGDFLPFARWCFAHCSQPESVLTRAEFARILASEEQPVRERTAVFFAAREELFRRCPERWLALHAPYEPVWSTLRARGLQPIIVTNKNRHAVLTLADHFGMPLDSANIYCGESGQTKSEHIDAIKRRFPNTPLTFLDDSLLNLLEIQAAHPDLPLLLATWGYLSPTDIQTAPTHHIRPITQAELLPLLPQK